MAVSNSSFQNGYFSNKIMYMYRMNSWDTSKYYRFRDFLPKMVILARNDNDRKFLGIQPTYEIFVFRPG